MLTCFGLTSLARTISPVLEHSSNREGNTVPVFRKPAALIRQTGVRSVFQQVFSDGFRPEMEQAGPLVAVGGIYIRSGFQKETDAF